MSGCRAAGRMLRPPGSDPCAVHAPLVLLLQILFEETLYQNASDGTPFVKMLQDKDIVPGIKARLPACSWPALARLASAPWVAGSRLCAAQNTDALGRCNCAQCAYCGILPVDRSVQVDKGVVALPGTDGETETQGIDDLGKR